jgi:hypothetical protein
MEIRTNAALSTHKVEIMLKTARGGGAGWGVIQDIVSEVNSYSLPSNSAMTSMAGNIVAGKTNDINNFWNMAKACGIEKEMTKKQFTQELKAVDKIWLHSKLGALELIHQLETAPKKKADLIINKIFNYAGSQSDLSSVYVKVYE